MFTKLIKSLYYLFCIICMMPCYGSDTKDEASYEYLKNLDIEALMGVEITLDEVFDVFDGLVKAKKVTVATGAEQSTTRAPAITTVITAQDIEASGARDLDEVLETVPGLHVSRSVRLYAPIYTIRGIYTLNNPEVLMLINGIPLTALRSGDRGLAWASMPLNMISRIEIIRGPGSAIYGADALAGVINIITKTKGDIRGTEVGARIGHFDTYEAWVLHSNTWKGIDIVASLEYQITDGQKNILSEDAQTQYDKLFKTHASLAPGPVSTGVDRMDTRIDIKKGAWQVRAGHQGRYRLGLGGGLNQALASEESYVTGERTNADITYHHPKWALHWDITTQLSYLNLQFQFINNRVFPRGAFGGTYPDGFIGNPGGSEHHTRFDTFAFYSGFQKHLARLGIGYHNGEQYQAPESKNFGTDPATGLPLPPGSPVIDVSNTPYAASQRQGRNNWYLSLQDTWTVTHEWEFTGGIRYDDYSDFGSTTNPRLALVWQPHHDFTTKLMYGRAFRAPSLIELYSKNNPTNLGNPNLKPETINTWEWALQYHAMSDLHLETNLFRYYIDDKIDTVPGPDGKSRLMQNVGHWKGEGLELEARWKINKKSSLLGHYSHTRAIDKKHGKDLGNYPQHSAYLRTDWLLIPNWYLDVQAKWIAKRKRPFNDPRPAIADYTTVDITLRYKDIHEGKTNIALSVRNLFNANAREPSLSPDSTGMIGIPDDLPLAGRSWFVEFRYRF